MDREAPGGCIGRACGDVVTTKSGQDHEVVALDSSPASCSPVILSGGRVTKLGTAWGLARCLHPLPAGSHANQSMAWTGYHLDPLDLCPTECTGNISFAACPLPLVLAPSLLRFREAGQPSLPAPHSRAGPQPEGWPFPLLHSQAWSECQTGNGDYRGESEQP